MLEVALPSIERLREVLVYEPDTGLFRWKVCLSNRGAVGAVAGHCNDGGYTQIRIDGNLYLAHCLAWFYMTGERPTKGVDHRDTNKQNNRWANLRPATKSQNGANAKRSRRNTSGFKGVHRFRDKWCAQICVNRKRVNLGLFGTPEEAHSAYAAAAEMYFGEFARAA